MLRYPMNKTAMNTHLNSQHTEHNERLRTLIAKAGWYTMAAATLLFAVILASSDNPRDNFKVLHKAHDADAKTAAELYRY